MSSKRVAVVTGANRGIGFAIVRALCKEFKGDVILTARNEEKGKTAKQELEKEGLSPKFHQLDITDKASIQRLKSFLESSYGGLDVLVNNAAIDLEEDFTMSFAEQAEVTVRCNFWGTLDVCNILFPLLRPHARVSNVSSKQSRIVPQECSEALKAKFVAKDLTMEDVEQLMTDFVKAAKDGTYKQLGWPEFSYGPSKIGVTLMSFVQQRQFNADSREDIIVNANCPGSTATDMSHFKGIQTSDQGADTPVYLALLPPNAAQPRGEFVENRKVTPWAKVILTPKP